MDATTPGTTPPTETPAAPNQHQNPPPQTPPAETPPAAETPPTPPPIPGLPADDPRQTDPMWRGVLAGLGLALGTDTATAAAPKPDEPKPDNTVGFSLSETLKFADERRAAEPPAATPEPPKEGDAGAPPNPPAPAAASNAPATAATPAATPSPDPEPKPVEFETRKPIEKAVADALDQALNKRFGDKPPGAESKPAEQTPEADPFEATLTDGERDELELARFAARTNPEQYKDLPAKKLAFFKKHAKYLETAALDSNRTLDEKDEPYVQFVKANNPQISASERNRLTRAQIAEEAERRAQEKLKAEIDRLNQKTFELETRPKVEQAVQTYARESERMLASDANSPAAPIVQQAQKEGWNKVLEQDQIFAPIVRGYHDQSTRLAAAYESIATGLTQFEENNPDHKWIHQFVVHSAEHFAKNGGDARVRSGRSFVTPAQYNAIVAEVRDGKAGRDKLDQHWTFSDRDVLERLAANTKMNIERALKAEEERLTRAGFKRQLPQTPTATPAAPPAAAANPPPARAETPSVRSTPSVAPGPGVTAQKPASQAAGSLITSVFGLPT